MTVTAFGTSSEDGPGIEHLPSKPKGIDYSGWVDEYDNIPDWDD